MSFSSWLRYWNRSLESRSALLKEGRGQLHRKSSRGIRPFLERLEDRLSPAILNYTVVAQSGETVTGPNNSSPTVTLTKVDAASINDSGNVAFLGSFTDSSNPPNLYDGVDEATVLGGKTTSLSWLSSQFTTRNFSFPQIDKDNNVIAQDKYLTVPTNNLDSYIRDWQPNGQYGVPYVEASATSSNSGDYVLHPVISPDGSHFAYQYQTPGQLSLYIDYQPVHAFAQGVNGSFRNPEGVNMQIANNGAVVLRDAIPYPAPTTYAISVYQKGKNPDLIANFAYFSELGSSPGISPDGQSVAFFGNLTSNGAIALNQKLANFGVPALNGGPPALNGGPLYLNGSPPYMTPGPGIFLSVTTKSHGRVILEVTSLANDSDANMPVAVTSDSAVGPAAPKGSVVVVFMGPDAKNASKTALYCNQIDLFGAPGQFGKSGQLFDPEDPQKFRVNANTIVAETGDSININGSAENITSLSIYDPINNNDQVAFCVGTDKGVNAVVEAFVFPVLAVHYFNQGDPPLPDTTYANGQVYDVDIPTGGGGSRYTSAPHVTFSSPGGGGVAATGKAIISNGQVTGVTVEKQGYGYGTTPPNISFEGGGGTGAKANANLETIQNAGCTLCALASALDYAGGPYMNNMGYTPVTLNNKLKGTAGFVGTGKILLPEATQIAANAAGISLNSYIETKFHGSGDLADLASCLRKYHAPVFVRVGNDSHSVIVTGMSDGRFVIIDPGHRANNNLSLEVAYPNGFTIDGVILDPPDVSSLTFAVEAPGTGANILVTNPLGQKTGTDANGNTVNGIPQSSTSSEPSEDDYPGPTPPATDQMVFISQPLVGTYTVSITGSTSEPFIFLAAGVGTDGSLDPATEESGTVTPGTPVTFTVPYTSQPPLSLSESSVTVTPDVTAAGETATVTLTTRDGVGNQKPSGGLKVAFGLGSGKGSGTFSQVKDNGDGTYTATFTGTTAGSNTITATIDGEAVTSTAPTVTVAIAPVVTTDPTSQIASAGNPVTFMAAAVSSPAPAVQWQVSSDGGNTFSNIAEANSTTLTFTTDASQNGNEYRAVFTNASGTATSTQAILTVNTTPSSLVVDASNGVFPQFKLMAPVGSAYFGAQMVTLTNGNIVATDPNGNGGAVYLFNGQTGALISSLTGLAGTGASAVYSPSVTALPNGNFVVASPSWDNGVGAVTWVNGTTGLSGTPSAANSLVGSTVFDHVGSGGGSGIPGITVLANGNYVADSPNWGSDGSGADGIGAVTWGNGTTGTRGVSSAANSLIGSTVYDLVGGYGDGVTALTNGNYVVDSPSWGSINGAGHGLGAVAWGNGATGTSGVVSATNSLVGSVADDDVGWFGVTALTNGNYVVDSGQWNGLTGAVTWGNGTTGTIGVVSAANSLVGSNGVGAGGDIADTVGSGGVTALTNGNYVVVSPSWSSVTTTYAGAVTWGDGTTGIDGPVSAANSLVGSNSDDEIGAPYPINNGIGYGANVGGGVTALANGNYVVDSPLWGSALSLQAGAGPIELGAVTWEDGTTPAVGTISAANSLIGQVSTGGGVGTGLVTALTNGNYVVASSQWNKGRGAVTWGDGTQGITGVISSNSSLVGSFLNDNVGGGANLFGSTTPSGQGGILALPNGNYVVVSPNWYADTGAVTWGDGTKVISGTISAVNSLVGDKPNDELGANPNVASGGVTLLTNGNYVVVTPTEGTATLGNGTTGIHGILSSVPSLNGAGGYAVPLPNGNYVVVVNNGNTNGDGVTLDASDTWVNGVTGSTLDGKNTIDAQNSLMGVAGVVPLFGGSAFLSTNPAGGQVTTGFTDPNLLTFALAQGQTITVTPSFLTSTLNTGDNVTVQANDDITINSPITENPAVAPGNLTLQAGRSILINANVNTAGGNLTLIGNDTLADGVINSERDPGDAVIAEQSGAAINTGTGTLTVDLKNGTDKTNNDVGAVTLPNVTASSETLSSSSTVGITINGTTPGDGVTAGTYTQLKVSGWIDLNGASLSITHSAVTAQGTTFIIVQSASGVSGTFSGLNEGATITALDGTEFTISYKSDGGKEVVLTQITPTPQAPAFTSSPGKTFTVGSAGSFKVTASGYPVPTLSESSSDTLPSGVKFNDATGVLSGTPAAGSSGTYTLNFTATNSLGSVSQTFMLTVNQTPAITSGNSVAFAIGYGGSFIVTATGSPTPTLKESGALPSGVSFTDNGDGTATLAGIPATGTTGAYHFSITAHNGVGSDFTQNFTLTVSQPQAPVITSVSSTAFTVGHGGSFTVTATGSPTPTLTESGALPSGVTFTDHSNGTATLGGTPAAGTKGTYQINITAENGLGSAYTQGFTLTVNLSPPPPPPPPVLPPPHPVLPPPPPHPPIVPPLLALFNQFLGDLEKVDANGTTITDSLFGFPMVETYDYFGNLVSVTLLGFNVTFLFG